MNVSLPNGYDSASAAERPGVPSVETLGQLVGQFAHDLSNLLATAMVGVEFAAQSGNDARRQELLAGVLEAIQRQRTLIAAMARAAQTCERPISVDAHALIEASSDEMRALLGTAALELRLDAASARIRCDPVFFRAALLHMAENASASMPNGGRLLLTTRNRAAPGGTAEGPGRLLLSAVDSGSGMSEDVRRHAFDVFFSTRGCAGLGLAQVRDTTRRAGGSVVLDTVLGEGTAITLELPLSG